MTLFTDDGKQRDITMDKVGHTTKEEVPCVQIGQFEN